MNNYKKYQALGAITLAAALTLFNPGTADSQLDTNVPSDVTGEQVLAIVVEDFENTQIAQSLDEDGWFVETSPKVFPDESTEEKLKMRNPVPTLDMKLLEGRPSDLQPEKWSITEKGTDPQQVLGIRFRFRYPGNNSVHVIPPKEVDWQEGTPVMRANPTTGQEEQHRAIQLPGRAQGISVWVHARGKPYTLEAWIEDYKGNTHILPMGSVNFVGWRPMIAHIPTYVPQETTTYPQTRLTKLTKFVLRANTRAPHETLIEDTFVFFDQIKVLTDTYEVQFDGSDLHRQFENNNQ